MLFIIFDVLLLGFVYVRRLAEHQNMDRELQ